MDVDIQKIPSPKLPAKYDLHGPRDALSVTEDFVQVLGTQNVPQSSLGEQPGILSISISITISISLKPGAVVSVLHVGHTDGGVADSVVDHRVHWGRNHFTNIAEKWTCQGIPIVGFIGQMSLYFP